ncbi:putative ABC transporter permease subunit [Deinococcus sonorensis]|uniref:ABC transporter permease n=1 Tax=Deinococcus sonorensis TaxID=309891 RepID=A0ABV8Y064_9DEIO
MNLLALKLRGLWNALRRGPRAGFVLLALLGALLVWAEVGGTVRALTFLGGFGFIGLGVFRRVLETGLLVLLSGVTFSAVTTAISTLYLSEDLNFLLALPLPVRRVFGLKVLETFLAAALVPTLLTVPLLVGLGLYRAAPAWFYPLAVLVSVLVYALPVGLGALLAVLLMRLAPVDRVREVATALGVLISAALVWALRSLHPERLLSRAADPAQLDGVLRELSGGGGSLAWPQAWAAETMWQAALGHLSPALWPLLLVTPGLLLLATLLAGHAYQAGWARQQSSARLRLDAATRPPNRLEQLAGRLGVSGLLAARDLQLTRRDPTQWSQLLVLVALAAVYLVSIRSLPLPPIPQFRGILGYVQLAFQGFVVAGVGVRLAFPAISLEGRAYWLLRTSPLTAWQLVRAKYVALLPVMLALSLTLAGSSAALLGLGPLLLLASLLIGAASALLITALGVGLGAALPRFTADNPAEIGFSAGGLIYTLLGLLTSLLLLALLARPAYLSVALPGLYPGLSALWTGWGLGGLLALLLFTLLGSWGALRWGAARLDRLE